MEYLPKVLWAYRTTRKSTTRETLFALAFGTEAVAPIEVGLESPRVKFASTKRNEETLRLNLDLLEEKREQALKHAEDYQGKTTRYDDRKVKPNSFKLDNLVFKKLLPAKKDPTHGKLGPNWEGPYIVSRVIRLGNYELQTKEGKTLQHSWNAEHLKQFYPYISKTYGARGGYKKKKTLDKYTCYQKTTFITVVSENYNQQSRSLHLRKLQIRSLHLRKLQSENTQPRQKPQEREKEKEGEGENRGVEV